MTNSVSLLLILNFLGMGISNSLDEIKGLRNFRKLFEFRTKNYDCDVILVGHYSKSIVYGQMGTCQVSLDNEDWHLQNFANWSSPYQDGNDQILVFLVGPTNLTEFVDYLSQIATYYETEGKLSRMRRRVMFFLEWPNSESHDRTEIIRTMKDDQNILSIPHDAQFYLLFGEEHKIGRMGNILEIYSIHKNVTVFNDCSNQSNNLTIDSILTFTKRRSDYQRVLLRTLGQRDSIYAASLDVISNPDQKVEFKGGACFNVLKDLETTLNFRTEPVNGSGWISQENGMLKGIGKQILDQEADICISAAAIVTYRLEKLYFLQPVYTQLASVIFAQPPVNSVRNVFTLPFAPDMWAATFITLLTISMVIFILSGQNMLELLSSRARFRHVGTSKQFSKYAESIQDKFSLADICIRMIAIVCRQGVRSPWNQSLRLIMMVSMLTCLVLYSAYTANLVVITSNPQVPIRDYSDLERNKFTPFVNPDIFGYAATFMPNEEEGQALRNRSKGIYVNDYDGVDKILRHKLKLAFIIPLDSYYAAAKDRYNESEICSLSHLHVKGGTTIRWSMFLRKGSDLQEFFQVKLILLMERGLNWRYWNEYKMKSELRCQRSSSGYKELDFFDFFPAFGMLLSAQGLSLILMLIEQFVYKFLRRQRN